MPESGGVDRPLLRQEVLRHRLPARFGPVSVSQPLSLGLYVLLCLLFCAALGLFLYQARFKASIAVAGVLQPEQAPVAVRPVHDGVYLGILVAEGDVVEAGQVIARISRDSYNVAGQAFSPSAEAFARAREQGLQAEFRLGAALSENEQSRMNEKRKALQSSLSLLQEELTVNRRRQAIAGEQMARLRSLFQRAAASRRELQEQQSALLLLEQESVQIRQRLGSQQRELRELDYQSSRAAMQQEQIEQELRLSGQRIEYERLSEAQDRHMSLVASRDGVVGPIHAAVGDIARAGSLLTRIRPLEQTLEARLYLPSSSIGQVHAGQSVIVTYDAYPYQRHGNHEAQVLRVSEETIDPREVQLPLPGLQEPVYRLRAELPAQSLAVSRNHGEARPLRAGMRLQAEIVTAERTLLEYILDPLLRLWRK